MKKIEAIIRPEKQDRVLNALSEGGFTALTVFEVRGRGAQKGITLQYRGDSITVDLIPKIEIMMVIDDDDVENAIQIIKKVAYTGKLGDGKIFVMPVERVEKVRD
ncbi:MAG: P-II family nitrogen regulator [Methanogenium sp.]|nr:P-II family nitrogen regulator [Methanogenium sp.]